MNSSGTAVAIPTSSTSNASNASMIDRYGSVLAIDPFWHHPVQPVEKHTELIPREDISALIQEIEVTLAASTRRELTGAVALIAAGWPYAHQKADATSLDLFVQQMMEDLAEFPPDILNETVRRLRRTLKFAPSIAELHRTARLLLNDRREQLSLAQKHLAEHRRRDRAA